jgi:putative transcriptional regulator
LTEIDIRALREKLGLSQSEFADRYQIALRTLQQWEQGRCVPDGPARAYLKVIAHNPGAVQRALNL